MWLWRTRPPTSLKRRRGRFWACISRKMKRFKSTLTCSHSHAEKRNHFFTSAFRCLEPAICPGTVREHGFHLKKRMQIRHCRLGHSQLLLCSQSLLGQRSGFWILHSSQLVKSTGTIQISFPDQIGQFKGIGMKSKSTNMDNVGEGVKKAIG